MMIGLSSPTFYPVPCIVSTPFVSSHVRCPLAPRPDGSQFLARVMCEEEEEQEEVFLKEWRALRAAILSPFASIKTENDVEQLELLGLYG